MFDKPTQLLFEREFQQILSKKNYMIRNHEGKKILTQKGEAALQEMKEFIQLYSEEISFENFEESMNAIKEIYDEKGSKDRKSKIFCFLECNVFLKKLLIKRSRIMAKRNFFCRIIYFKYSK